MLGPVAMSAPRTGVPDDRAARLRPALSRLVSLACRAMLHTLHVDSAGRPNAPHKLCRNYSGRATGQITRKGWGTGHE